MQEKPHPLRAWLKKRKLKPYKFADSIKMPRRTLYDHLDGTVTNPSLQALQAIEKGTEGRDIVRVQSVWFAAQALLQGVEDDEDGPPADEAEEPDEIGDENEDPRDDVQP